MADKRTKQSSPEAHTVDETLWKIEKCHKEVKIASLHTRSLENADGSPCSYT